MCVCVRVFFNRFCKFQTNITLVYRLTPSDTSIFKETTCISLLSSLTPNCMASNATDKLVFAVLLFCLVSFALFCWSLVVLCGIYQIYLTFNDVSFFWFDFDLELFRVFNFNESKHFLSDYQYEKFIVWIFGLIMYKLNLFETISSIWVGVLILETIQWKLHYLCIDSILSCRFV